MDLSGAVAIDTTSKVYWGPRLWQIFHHLAEISNRRDMMMMWNILMRLTSAVMPCEQCRFHLANYMKMHTFVRFTKIHLVTGEMVRLRARTELYNLHNDVNTRLGKTLLKESDIIQYRVGRAVALTIIHKNYDEIKAAWTPLVHGRIDGGVFNEWKKHLNLMIALAAGGPA
jgi:hypothetical protein